MEIPADVEGLIFDCDGTLVDTGPVYARAWGAAFASAGHTMAPEWYLARAGMSEPVLIDAFEAAHGVTLDRNAIVAALREGFLGQVDAVREIDLIAGIARRERGRRRLAVGSGGSETVVRASLEACGLLGLFDAVVTFDAVGRAKPAPDIFLEAARRLDVRPAHCLVFEDSHEGLSAARAAGMRVVSVPALLEGRGVEG